MKSNCYEIVLVSTLDGEEIFYFKTELYKACNCNGATASVIEEPNMLTVIGEVGNRPHFESVLKKMERCGCVVCELTGDVEL